MGRIQFTKATLQKISSAGAYGFGRPTGPAGSAGSAYNRLIVYKGVIPTQAELLAFPQASVPRLTDILINYSAINLFEAFENFKIKIKSTAYTAATASGEATWFAFVQGDTGSDRARSIAMGTVSGLGGAGELKISDTNIISGNSYIVKPMEIILPYKFDF